MTLPSLRTVLSAAFAGALLGLAVHTEAADQASEKLVVVGAVKSPLSLAVDDLDAFPAAQIETVTVARRVDDKEVASVVRGVRLTAVLDRAGLVGTDHNAWKRIVLPGSGRAAFVRWRGWPSSSSRSSLLRPPLSAHLTTRIAMKTSARNQFAGTASAVKSGAINDEIELQVEGGLHVVATVTHESREALGLEPGAKAFALVKASSVILMTDASGVRLSARNQFAGTVAHVTPGAVNTEVVVDLPGGGSVAAIITNESAKSLGLTKGAAVTAVFKASSAIVGVAA